LVAGDGVTSEVGRLRTVLLHRPGDELKRLTPRNNVELLFDGIPWLERAQEEHDAFAAALGDRGVEVLYFFDLLTAALEVPQARAEVVNAAVAPAEVGPALAPVLREHLLGLSSEQLAEVLTAGLYYEEITSPGALRSGVVARLAPPHSFVIPPLPNLLFTRDSSVWLDERVAVTSPFMPARVREATLARAIYRYAPRFAGTPLLYGDVAPEHPEAYLEGGDVLLLAPGAAAIGVGERTTPAGAETLAARALEAGVVRVVLAVPVEQRRATMHLDTVCTMVDTDAVVMYPPIAHTLQAFPVTAEGASGPRPFLTAAAEAMGIERLRVIETGLDPVTAEREQWDDGNNTLAIAPRLVVAYERNVETNARLEDAGIEVVRIRGSELGSGRGGPRCMSCPVARERP
jgi:arginine deiminase